jgi:3-oxoadipate enol-lactonase
MASVPERTYRAAVTALVAFDQRANLPRIGVPTLVITGEHDATAPPKVSQRMAELIPGARVHIVPGAGHLLPMEQPDSFADAVLALWPAP